MMRWDIINHLIKQNGYKSYLEIGYYKGWSFDRIECEHKTAVDPNPSKTPDQEQWPYGKVDNSWSMDEAGDPDKNYDHFICKMTSDEFFAKCQPNKKWDIIFVDGKHTAEQAFRDAQNAFLHLSPGGVVVMHDCNPPLEIHTTSGSPDGEWTGDVYKAAALINRSIGIDFLCVDTDWGVGIIRKTLDEIKWLNPDENPPIYWNFFNTHRKTAIGLVSPEEWLEYEKLLYGKLGPRLLENAG